MTLELRILLIVVSALAMIYVVRKIRESKLNIVDSIFWIIVSLILILMALFPGIADFFSRLIGVATPMNFILMLIIAILLLKVFLMTIQISQQNEKIKILAQKIAMDEFSKEKDEKEPPED